MAHSRLSRIPQAEDSKLEFFRYRSNMSVKFWVLIG